jgi:dTDP-4-amino-4,6-dideoxygalactose transaminase
MAQRVTPIGGEMELDLATLTQTDESAAILPFSSYQTVTSGRTAIKLILKTIEESGTFLLPSYLCASILQPFKECNVPVAFYRINDDLSIDLDDLMHRVDSVRPAGLLFIDYFGFPVKPIEAKALREIAERCLITEDCVQGSLIEANQPVIGQIGDFVITSFRKYLPVPDGGLIVNRTDHSLAQLPPATDASVRYRLLGKFLRHEFWHGNRDHPQLEETYLALFAAAESALDTAVPLEGMSRISHRVLGMVDLADAMAQRRRNFSFLSQAFAEEPQVRSIGRPVLTDLPSGVSPLAFPIRVATRKRDALRRELIAQAVFCPIHWHLPAEISETGFAGSCKLSQQILSLPIDQRYNDQDMKMLLDRLVRAWGKVT